MAVRTQFQRGRNSRLQPIALPDLMRERQAFSGAGVAARLAWTAPMLLIMVVGVRAEGSGDSEVHSLVRRCLDSQSRFDRISARGVTDIVDTRRSVPDGIVVTHQVEYSLHRDGDLIDVSGRFRILTNPDRVGGYNFRYTSGEEMRVDYQCGHSEKRPSSGVVFKQDKDREFAGLLASAYYGFALDGCMRLTGGKYSAWLLLQADDLRIRGEETLDDVPCTIVEGTTQYGGITLWIAESKGCCALKITLEQGPDDLAYLGETLSQVAPGGLFDPREYPGQSAVRRVAVLNDVTLSEVEGTYVPVGGRFAETLHLSGGADLTSAYVYNRTEVDYDPDFVGSDVFVTDLPNGARVYYKDDSDSGVVYMWRDGRVVPAYAAFTGGAKGIWGSRTGPLGLAVSFLGTLTLLAAAIWLYHRHYRRA